MAAPGAACRPWSSGVKATASWRLITAEKLCRSLPDARFELIPEAGHYPQIERPDAVADAIERFARAEVKS